MGRDSADTRRVLPHVPRPTGKDQSRETQNLVKIPGRQTYSKSPVIGGPKSKGIRKTGDILPEGNERDRTGPKLVGRSNFFFTQEAWLLTLLRQLQEDQRGNSTRKFPDIPYGRIYLLY